MMINMDHREEDLFGWRPLRGGVTVFMRYSATCLYANGSDVRPIKYHEEAEPGGGAPGPRRGGG